jgi:hypothetical protein
MITTFLPYVRCLVPVGAVAVLVLGFVLAQKMIGSWIITRPIPPGGYPSVEDEIRYVNEEPAEMRRIWRYKSWFIIAGVTSVCMPLSIVLPNMVLKMVMK